MVTVPRATYLIGPPGVGKTSVMDALLEPYARVPQPVQLRGLLRAELLVEPRSVDGQPVGIHLGYRRTRFSGTDVLGMAVQRDATRWLESDPHPTDLYGEGQRLGNAPFLTLAAKHYDLTVIHLTAPEDVLDARCRERGSTQSDVWRKGSATRASAAADRLREAGVKVVPVEAEAPLADVVSQVRDAAGR